MDFSYKDKVVIKYIRFKCGHNRKLILKGHPGNMEWIAGGLRDLLRRIDRNASRTLHSCNWRILTQNEEGNCGGRRTH